MEITIRTEEEIKAQIRALYDELERVQADNFNPSKLPKRQRNLFNILREYLTDTCSVLDELNFFKRKTGQFLVVTQDDFEFNVYTKNQLKEFVADYMCDSNRGGADIWDINTGKELKWKDVINVD